MKKFLLLVLRFLTQVAIYSLLIAIFEFENGFIHILEESFVMTCGFAVADLVFRLIQKKTNRSKKQENDMD